MSSSATILGLIITAFGIIVTLGDENNQVIVRNFALVFVIVVILFACSVLFTAISSLLEKKKLWNCALIVYIIGWAFLGTVLIVTLLGYAYGIEMFQIELPQYNFEVVNIIALSAGITTGILTAYFSYDRVKRIIKSLTELSSKLKVDQEDLEYSSLMLQKESWDLNEELIILRTEIEREARKLADLAEIDNKIERKYVPFGMLIQFLLHEQMLSPQLATSLRFIYSKLSRAVHGELLSDKESKLTLEIGLKTLITLKEYIEEFGSK